MARNGSSVDRITAIIYSLRDEGWVPSYGEVVRRLRAQDPQGRLRCSPNTIYAVFDRLDVHYGRRPRRRSRPVGTPGNPFISTRDPYLDDQKPACFFCGFWRVSLEDLQAEGRPVRMECRRTPPQPGGSEQTWPITRPHDWCGEFSDNADRMLDLHPSHLGLLYYAGICPDGVLGSLGNKWRPVRFEDDQIAGWLGLFSASALTMMEQGCRRLPADAPVPLRFMKMVAATLSQRG
ncbi:MAG: hypothetical protein HQL38_13060 [Alphaproteobacteria bacterium]|nr:hypothetical protein [Alphaproteobacteria bacterium]